MLTNTAGRWWGFLEIDAALSELDPDVPESWWSNRAADIVVMPESGGLAGKEPIRMVIRARAATQHERHIHLLIEST